ncbi:izumo sperm-egg fusion protein 1 isoform X2 [Cynoglossus semilaevis]|nr:izumo sperm-egg fusion protein 1 isoform X2 [Cynoglossus semilaevis]
MLIGLLLLFCLPTANTCLQCNRRVRHLHDNMIQSSSLADELELQKIFSHGVEMFREISEKRKGVIDTTTLYRVRDEYINEFDRIMDSPFVVILTQKAISIVSKGQEILEQHLDSWIHNGLCPNTCGVLRRRVIDCSSCNYKIYTCPSPTGQLDCGEVSVRAEEEEQALLDCFRPWHPLLFGKLLYHYSWSPGKPRTKMSEGDFRPLVVKEEASVVLNQVQVEEQGTYRCSLKSQTGTSFFQLTFLVTVVPLHDHIDRTLVTLPPNPFEDDSYYTERLLVTAIVTLTVLSVAASVGLIVIMR